MKRFSILTDDLEHSYMSGRLKEDIHHCVFGRGRRQIAEKNGFLIPLTHEEHMKVHQNRKMQLFFIRKCQRKYEETHTREDWLRLVGRNYLESEEM